jgi:hypothetical protein
MTPPSSQHLSGRDWLDRIGNNQSNRRRFLGTALASAAMLALPACTTPTFDPNTTTLTFRRRSHGGSGRN